MIAILNIEYLTDFLTLILGFLKQIAAKALSKKVGMFKLAPNFLSKLFLKRIKIFIFFLISEILRKVIGTN